MRCSIRGSGIEGAAMQQRVKRAIDIAKARIVRIDMGQTHECRHSGKARQSETRDGVKERITHSAISSAHSSGFSVMKRDMSAMQSGSSAMMTSTPRDRRNSSLPPKFVVSPITTRGIPN